jgi:predicted transcriptional regulator
MLLTILKEFKESGGAINLDELSLRLGVERSALDGMLDVLVRQGKLQTVCAAGTSACGSCGTCHCGGNATQAQGKSFRIIAE